jgi:hypothetical protein
VIPQIRDAIVEFLNVQGHEVYDGGDTVRKVDAEKILAYAEWYTQISGPNSIQPDFDYVAIAISVIAFRLDRDLSESHFEGPLTLEVIPLNQIGARKVGWAARLLMGE